MDKFKISFKSLALILIAFVLYYLSAKAGLALATLNKQASPVWPASGIAMGMMLFWGPRVGIGIFLGALVSNYETGLNLSAALVIGLGNSLESLFFYIFFSRIALKYNSYGIYTKAILSILVMVCACVISASFGTFALWASSLVAPKLVLENWVTWWIGDFLAALFLVPLFYHAKKTSFRCFLMDSGGLLKLVTTLLATSVLLAFIFLNSSGGAFVFIIFLAILLAANWLDASWVYVLSLIVGIVSIYQTLVGNGPFAGSQTNDNLIHLQIFLAGLGITAVGISSLKQQEFYSSINFGLLFGWALSGMTFYSLHTSMKAEENHLMKVQAAQIKSAVTQRMNDYFRMLESGVSYFNASVHVSQEEWRLFSEKMLSTNSYPGIEGYGVIFSSSIQQRFANDKNILMYQPTARFKNVSGGPTSLGIKNPDDNYIITYLEPRDENLPALGLNVSSERNRYEAATQARDSGKLTITDEINLVQDRESRMGILIYVPIYKTGAFLTTVQERQRAHIGFVYAPVIVKKFVRSAVADFEQQFLVKFYRSHGAEQVDMYESANWSEGRNSEITEDIEIAGKHFKLSLKKEKNFPSSTGLASSWIGFFGTMISLFLAVILSSLQNIMGKAQSLAVEMTKEVETRKRTWQALTETSPVGIYMTDKNGSCTYVNSTWTHLAGLSLEEAQGQGWISALHPEDVELVSKNWEQLVGGESFVCNYRFLRKDRTVVHVTGQAIALKDESSVVTGYFGTVQDVTELHLNQMALAATSRMSSLGQMASGVAHEINNPLAIIQGKAYLLEKMLASAAEIDVAKAKTNVSQIQMTVQRIAKIIRGLQSFARDSSEDPHEKVLLDRVLEDAMEMCQERFVNHGIQLNFSGDSARNLEFIGRSEQIAQVLLNLLNNAHDAVLEKPPEMTPKETKDQLEKWVTVSIQSTSTQIIISVSDSGPGVPVNIQDKLFTPFFTTKPVGSGIGLGLSISKGIITKHQGRLYLDTSKSFTTFVIEIPRTPSEASYGA